MPRRRLSFRGIPWSGYGEMDTVYIEIWIASVLCTSLLLTVSLHCVYCSCLISIPFHAYYSHG